MGSSNPSVSETELVVLKFLWELGSTTVRELLDELEKNGYEWAYTTVQTLLQRLEAKGFVKADRKRAVHVYEAAVSRESFMSRELEDLAEKLFEGAATPLVVGLMKSGRFSREDIAHFRRLLDEAEDRTRTRGRRKK